MPYKSDAQRRFMHARHPGIAAKWDEEIRSSKKKGRIRKAKKDWAIGLSTAAVGGALANQVPPVKLKRKKKGKVEKMLVPVSTDPDFNQEAAQKAFDLVMKMDDDTAEVFCHIVVSDYFEETMEKNLGTLQRHLDETLVSQLEELKKAHLRVVAKGMDEKEAVAYAQAIVLFENLISKDQRPKTPQERGYVWRERDFNRDPSSGQFRAKVKRTQTRELNDPVFQQLTGASTPTEHGGVQLSEEDRTRFQDEYRQLAGFLDTVKESTGAGGNRSVMLHYRDNQGAPFSRVHYGKTPPADDLADPSYRLEGMEAKPTALTAGGAAFGLAGALGGNLNPGQVQAITAAGAAGGTFADKWVEPGNNRSSNAQLYNRMAASGNFLQATGLPKAQLAGKFASIVGNAGPQAEMVLGPTTRKTAYRYRGTEKTPESDMVATYGERVKQGKVYGEWPEGGSDAVRDAYRRQKPGHAPPLHRQAALREAEAARAPTWRERELGRQALVDHLRRKMPTKQLYELQLASGNTPPSEGVIINANGQLVTQAVGYGDDHYLPFNLKNLKGLKGGEYIRTRSVGGLTSEDIYTAMMMGARQVTVTSRSGTYTMTFEPDFRGGRRHNDKARRMTRRYEQLLDAVQSQQVERIEIDPNMRAEIEREVKEEMSGPQWRHSDRRAAIQERIDEFKENPYITEEDEKRAEVIINGLSAGMNESGRNKIRAQVMDDLMDQKETKFRLNSAGYKAALDGLQEQFPYYISKPRWTPPRDEGNKIDTGLDMGYVEPGRNRPTAASAGLFGAKTRAKFAGQGNKFSASQADYQGGKLKAVALPEGDEEVTGSLEGSKDKRHSQRMKAIAEGKLDAELVEAGMEVQRHAASSQGLNEQSRKDPLNARMLAAQGDEMKGQAFRDWATEYVNLSGFTDVKLKRRWEAAAGHRDRRDFNRENTVYTKQPPFFPGEPAYELGAEPRDVIREVMSVDRKAHGGVVSGSLPYSALDDAEAEKEHRALAEMHRVLKDDPTPLTPQELTRIGADPTSPALVRGKLRESPEAVLDQLELLQRARALQANMTDEHRKQLQDMQSVKIEEHETPTSEEQAKPREQVATQIAWGKRVLGELYGMRGQIEAKLKESGVNSTHRQALLNALDKLPDEQTTERAQNAVAMFEANQDTLRTKEDLAALNDSMMEELNALMEASAILSQQREHVGVLLNPPRHNG